jgi:hypothetical protein
MMPLITKLLTEARVTRRHRWSLGVKKDPDNRMISKGPYRKGIKSYLNTNFRWKTKLRSLRNMDHCNNILPLFLNISILIAQIELATFIVFRNRCSIK